MKKLFAAFILLTLISIANKVSAQKVLFVDDNDYILYNSDTLINGLKSTNYTLTTYNIEKNGGIAPTLQKMLEYDFVIWYTSTDGVLLNFWESNTQENIKKYIDSGKPMWIIGLDLLFAKYGLPPVQFFETEFAYDYLGIEAYKAQSYGNDGQMGCPQMDKSSMAQSNFPSVLKWTFSTLWWADACDITPQSKELYHMGPASYELAGGVSMHFNEYEGRKVLCTFFDPALIDTYGNRIKFLKSALDFLNIASATKDVAHLTNVKLYPNPTFNEVNIKSNQALQRIELMSIDGRIISSYDGNNSQNKSIDVTKYDQGIYIINCIFENGHKSIHKIIKQR